MSDRIKISYVSVFQPLLKALRRKPRILILDSHQEMLDVFYEALKYANYEVQCTCRTNEFKHFVTESPPDLIILDLKLVDGKGDELCRELKTNDKTRQIPLILCSAYLRPDDDISGYGCDAIIAKPFGLEEMNEIVARHLKPLKKRSLLNSRLGNYINCKVNFIRSRNDG